MFPLFSLCASACRPEHWEEVLMSLKSNTIRYEVVFVGHVRPTFDISKYPELKYIYSTVKPAQCYEIAFRNASGQLMAWTADDATYPANALDKMYGIFENQCTRKDMLAFRTVEDGKDITEVHRFRGRDMNAPRMAPFGVINRGYFHELGGYDRRFICGQSENDVVMRMYEAGGKLYVTDIPVIVDHRKSHHDSGTVFRSGYYLDDRRVLEDAWVRDGNIQPKRLREVERFDDADILINTQGQRGKW